MSGGKCQGRGTAAGVADEVEPPEGCLVGDPGDAGDLGLEGEVGLRGRTGVDLEVLGPGIDVGAELREEGRIGWLGRHDAAGKEDHAPGTRGHQRLLRAASGGRSSSLERSSALRQGSASWSVGLVECRPRGA